MFLLFSPLCRFTSLVVIFIEHIMEIKIYIWGTGKLASVRYKTTSAIFMVSKIDMHCLIGYWWSNKLRKDYLSTRNFFHLCYQPDWCICFQIKLTNIWDDLFKLSEHITEQPYSLWLLIKIVGSSWETMTELSK